MYTQDLPDAPQLQPTAPSYRVAVAQLHLMHRERCRIMSIKPDDAVFYSKVLLVSRAIEHCIIWRHDHSPALLCTHVGELLYSKLKEVACNSDVDSPDAEAFSVQ